MWMQTAVRWTNENSVQLKDQQPPILLQQQTELPTYSLPCFNGAFLSEHQVPNYRDQPTLGRCNERCERNVLDSPALCAWTEWSKWTRPNELQEKREIDCFLLFKFNLRFIFLNNIINLLSIIVYDQVLSSFYKNICSRTSSILIILSCFTFTIEHICIKFKPIES